MRHTFVSNRNPSFELLRVVSMLMIVSLHFFMHGGVLDATEIGTWENTLFYFLQGIFYVSVNQFVLISGYFGIQTVSAGKLYRYYAQVLFYAVLTFMLAALLDQQQISLQNLLYLFTPISSKVYWFASKYFILLLLAPLLQKLIENLSVKQHLHACLLLILIFSIWPSIIFWQDIGLGNGFDFFWLATVYFLGAYLKRKQVSSVCSISSLRLLSILIISFVCMPLTRLFFGKIDLSVGTDFFYRYNSPLVLLSSIALFLLFSRLSLPKAIQRIALFFGPYTFGVYLIHDSSFAKELLWNAIDATKYLSYYPWKTIGYMAIVSCGVFLIGCFIEYCRSHLYRMFGGGWIEKKLNIAFQMISRKYA